jgi:adenylosuccinate lyase
MPHKRNPHKSERVCSLARRLKSNVINALDNVVLEDERDLTNSASERVIFAENFVFLDFMIKEMSKNFKDIELNEENIKRNLNLTKGACLAEKVMIELVKKGFGRQEAHELLRKTAIKAREEDKHMKDLIMEYEKINDLFTQEEINNLFNPEKYIGKAIEQVENLDTYFNNKYGF